MHAYLPTYLHTYMHTYAHTHTAWAWSIRDKDGDGGGSIVRAAVWRSCARGAPAPPAIPSCVCVFERVSVYVLVHGNMPVRASASRCTCQCVSVAVRARVREWKDEQTHMPLLLYLTMCVREREHKYA